MSRIPHPPRTRVGLLLIATAALACPRSPASSTQERGAVRGEASTPRSPEPRLAQLGHSLGVDFPAGARLVGTSSERGIDDLIELKVEMAAGDLPAFLARSPVRPEDFAAGERGLLGPDHDWWDPNRAPRLRTGQTQLPKGRVLNIGLDDSRPGVVVVYVVNHGT